jgi:hypothetical protein
MGQWKLVAPLFGPIGVAIALVVTHFDSLKAAAAAAFAFIQSAIGGVVSAIESVVGAVERLIGALGRIHVPKINLPGPLLAPPLSPATRGVGPGSYAAAGGGGTTINVYGSLDPEGTARAVLRVLRAHERRQGRR